MSRDVDQDPPRVRGARERARAEVEAAIVAEARRQLAEVGAEQLSLRSVARELGMVSSAVYRYVSSKDELLTQLIVTSYDSLGAHAEAAVATAGGSPTDRWVAAALAVRSWAVERPHEFALLYGTPVRGYHAPVDTIDPASRTTLALVGIVTEAWRAGCLTPPAAPVAADVADADLHRELRELVAQLGTDLPDAVVVRVLAAWTQLFGLVAFELFGQTRNAITAHAALLAETARAMAHTIGLDAVG